MLGRVKDAVADAAETLRQAFGSLAVTAVQPEPFQPARASLALLEAVPQGGLEAPATTALAMPRLRDEARLGGLPPFEARVQAEEGWARWGAEAQVARMAPLEPGAAARMAVPPLPRAAAARGRVEAPARPAIRRWSEPAFRAATRREAPDLAAPAARAGLRAILTYAVPIQKEDIQRLPKGLWMRYSLNLVRGTGENVRNLEVVGLYRLPRKGVSDLRLDPRRDRILVKLEPLAVGAARAPFILAKRRDDGALLSCFVEDP